MATQPGVGVTYDDFVTLAATELPADNEPSCLTVGDVKRLAREARALIDAAEHQYLDAVRTIGVIVLAAGGELRIDPRDAEALSNSAIILSFPDWRGGTTLVVEQPERST